ncbi:MAG: hypothetical protein H6R18_936, partial [Proteobacteria bacterium]|nr:hypothetical protein [Pseudomonadota bacterium]
MRNHFPVLNTPIRHRSCRLALLSGMAIVAILQSSMLLADDSDQVAYSNNISAPQAAISWISGGIGDDARDEMRKAAAAYNVHIVFS